jgi:hypothetical protein
MADGRWPSIPDPRVSQTMAVPVVTALIITIVKHMVW